MQKTTNPEGYAANILAWQSALTRAAVAGKLPTDHRLILQASEDLLDALVSPQYGRPSGLGLVLDDSVKNGKMVGLSEFRTAEHSIYQRSWIPSPMAVLKWGLKQAGVTGQTSYDKGGRLKSGQLVLVSALEDLHKQIVVQQNKKGNSLTDRVMTREDFISTFAHVGNEQLSILDTDILLRYLARDKALLTYDSKTVKFKSPTANEPEAITSEDTTIANLRSLMASLNTQISNLTVKIGTLQTNAKTAVEAKNKLAAMSALKSKKLAERTLQQRTDTLSQLEEVYSKIEQAVDQVQIIEVMQSSTLALKSLNKKIGGVERVEDVVEELKEEMDKVDEVGQVLQEPLDSKAALDEFEVDDELEEMEREERRKEEEREAEITRMRLAELEEADRRKQKEEQQERAALELKLKNSIERLDKMRLDAEKEQGVGSNGEITEQAKERERVLEPAS